MFVCHSQSKIRLLLIVTVAKVRIEFKIGEFLWQLRGEMYLTHGAH